MSKTLPVLLLLSLALLLPACSADTPEPGEKVAISTNLDEKPQLSANSTAPPGELVVKDIVRGSGPAVKPFDTVQVQYVGALWDSGQEFDSSWANGGAPFETAIGAGKVIAGWDEGIVGMRVGGRRELIIPPDKGYGDMGSPPTIPGGATLVFVVDLVAIK